MSTQYFINKCERKVSVHISRRSSICCPSWKRVHWLRLRQIGTTCGGDHEYLIWMRHSKRRFAETDNHLLVTRYLKYQTANTARTSEDHRMRSYYPTKKAVGGWVFFSSSSLVRYTFMVYDAVKLLCEHFEYFRWFVWTQPKEILASSFFYCAEAVFLLFVNALVLHHQSWLYLPADTCLGELYRFIKFLFDY